MKPVFTLCVQLTVFKHVEQELLFGLMVTAVLGQDSSRSEPYSNITINHTLTHTESSLCYKSYSKPFNFISLKVYSTKYFIKRSKTHPHPNHLVDVYG